MTTVAICAICLAATAFLIRFFIALCRDRNTGACHVVHILQGSERRDIVRTWTGTVHSVARAVATARGSEADFTATKYGTASGRVLSEQRQA
jgi:hypothetical protein